MSSDGRGAANEDEPPPRSWAEIHLEDIRDRTFHYPEVGSAELREALSSCGAAQSRIRESGPRPFDFADVVALHAAFGDVDQAEERARFEEIVIRAKQIQTHRVPVVWSALKTYLESRSIDVQRFRAAPSEPGTPAEPPDPR